MRALRYLWPSKSFVRDVMWTAVRAIRTVGKCARAHERDPSTEQGNHCAQRRQLEQAADRNHPEVE